MIFLASSLFVTFWTLAVAYYNLALAASSLASIAAFLCTEALKSAFLRVAFFLAALSWALKAATLLECLAKAIFALMAAIFFLSRILVSFLTFLVTLARTVLALASLALMAAFWSGRALKSAFLRVTTFWAALSWALKVAFLTGFFAAEILAAIFSTFLASNFLVTYWTLLVAATNLALATTILALIAGFLASEATAYFFLRAKILFAILRCFFNAALLSGCLAAASLALMAETFLVNFLEKAPSTFFVIALTAA